MPLLAEVAQELNAAIPQILARWRARVSADAHINAAARLTRSQFNDHIPFLLQAFAQRLRLGDSPEQDAQERELSESHGRHRWQQGYDLRGMVREWGHLNVALVVWLDENKAPTAARELWAEFVAFNEAEAIALYEELLQSEARAKLHDMERALGELQEWERARGALLREASHDLRGGLSVVMSASSLMGHPDVSPQQREQVADLLESGVRNLTDMMTDLLDMARLEAGIETREARPFDASALLEGMCASWRALAGEKGLRFEQNGPLTLVVEGDAVKVRRIAQNLALNAIKYTQHGQVRVTWGKAEGDVWFLEIADTGDGLETSGAAPLAQNLESAAPDAPPSDFLPQKTGHSSGGEGIGLAIVRRLCELLDASIEMHSSDEGSTFRLCFPIAY